MHCRSLISLTVVLAIITINHCSGMELLTVKQQNVTIPHEQHIFFLNGTTTAGKSSIALELKELLQVQSLPVEIFASDTFFVPKLQWALGINRLNPFNFFVPTVDIITSSEIEAIRAESRVELCKAARASYEQGNIVIIDAPAYSDQMNFYKQALTDLKVTWSLVYCPISTLVERVISRNERSGITGQRSVLQALDQFSQFYNCNTNCSIDILSQETIYATCSKAREQHVIMQDKIPDFLKSVQTAICPFDCDSIQQSLLVKFALYSNAATNIGPVVQHDCIVNTELNNSASCAQAIIKAFLLKQIKG